MHPAHDGIPHGLHLLMWLAWGIYWLVSARGAKKTVRRETLAQRLVYLIPMLLLAPLFFSCQFEKSKKLDRRISLRRNDDIPYGTKAAYEGLTWLFPTSDVTVNKKHPSSLSSGESTSPHALARH